ncbi:MAG: autotransporter outer membrane beta-barrel domain-containing protein, partial [Planctomycetota bacterium]|nr:autotransporter outer membrane beta-barrel domain-containing protein [Planctomycetota bacterium]
NADSSRPRLGARVAWTPNSRLSPYGGLAWENEFSARARASASDLSLSVPSPQGHTGKGELGLVFRPRSGLTLDLSAQGFVGKRRGATGKLLATIDF